MIYLKTKKGEKALTGMDLVRLMLERASTAREAIKVLDNLLSLYGQGGECGYSKSFLYHSVIIYTMKVN